MQEMFEMQREVLKIVQQQQALQPPQPTPHVNNSSSAQEDRSAQREANSENPYGTLGAKRCLPGGLTGLINFGHTCFINSVIQCLVHTPEFARYFGEDYNQEGELALAFGQLLLELWAPGRIERISPRPFKEKLYSLTDLFSGQYSQHDSQELLVFLLEGLHDDLNRIKHKPNKEFRDADGRPDEVLAEEYWANHIACNDSIIVDVCEGQYKSTLVCPVCNGVSVTFDRFKCLTLPIPVPLQSTTNRRMTVTVFSCDGTSLPYPCTVTVPAQGQCRDLIQALSNACSLKHNERIVLVEVRNHVIQRFCDDDLQLLSIKDDDRLAGYKIPEMHGNTKHLQLIHRRREQSSDLQTFGTPIVSLISCDDTITGGDIQVIVNHILSPLLLKGGNAHDTVSKAKHLPKLPLSLVDDNNACIDLLMGEAKVVNLSSSSKEVIVYIDWCQKLLEKYDTRPLETLPEVSKYGAVTTKAHTEPLSLYDCLDAFLCEEPLAPDNMWDCSKCGKKQLGSKKLEFCRLPEVLIIHLKRFSYSKSSKVADKLKTMVNFPIDDFDLTKYISNKNNSRGPVYELYALINHYGNVEGGHYTAYIKLLDENSWHNFNDGIVSPVKETEVITDAAYLLFYRMVKTDDEIVM